MPDEWAIGFRNARKHFVAWGTDKEHLPVYRVAIGTANDPATLTETAISFPNCLRFMPYAEEVVPMRRKRNNGFTRKYGPLVALPDTADG